MGKLLAAAAVRNITPTQEILELVNQEGRYHYEGIERELFLRTLVLTDGEKRFVYFGTDLSGFTFNSEAVERFRSELGLEPQDYIFGTNRSHNTISGWGQDLHDIVNRPGSCKFGQMVIESMISSVREAMEKLKPARIGAREGYSGISCSRELCTPAGNFEGMNHGAPAAPWLRVVRVEDMEGETIALLVNYCMQNCMVSGNTDVGKYNYVTSDLAGEIIAFLERAGKHKYPVIWSNGGGADRQPLIYSRMDHCQVDDEGNYYHAQEVLPIDAVLMIMRHLAAEQGLDVMRTVEQIDNYSDEFRYFSGVEECEVPGKTALSRRMDFYRPGLDDVSIVPDAPIKFRYAMNVINDIAFCAVNVPSYSGVYRALREMMPFPVVVFSDDSFGGSGMACIPVPECEEEDRYVHATLQSRSYTARMGFNACMNGFGKLLERYMLQNIYTYRNAPYPEIER